MFVKRKKRKADYFDQVEANVVQQFVISHVSALLIHLSKGALPFSFRTTALAILPGHCFDCIWQSLKRVVFDCYYNVIVVANSSAT